MGNSVLLLHSWNGSGDGGENVRGHNRLHACEAMSKKIKMYVKIVVFDLVTWSLVAWGRVAHHCHCYHLHLQIPRPQIRSPDESLIAPDFLGVESGMDVL